MSLFHRHVWVEEARQVRRPVSEFDFKGGLWGEPHNDAFRGYTLILYCCSECGRHRTSKLVGPWPSERSGDSPTVTRGARSREEEKASSSARAETE